jgi:hypothetical protein
MLRIRRLRGRHAVFMHGRSTVIPGAASAVRHQWVGRRSTGARSRARLEHRGRRVASIVRISHPRRLRPLRCLLGLLRWRRRRWRRCVVRLGGRGWSPSGLLGHPVGFLIRPHLLFLGTGRSLTGGDLATKGLTLCGIRIPRLRGNVDIRDPPSPRNRATWARWCAVKHRLRCGGSRPCPLWSRGSNRAGSLVSLGMNIGGHRRLRGRAAISLSIPEQLKPCLYVNIGRVQLSSTLIRVERISDLVTALILQIQASVAREAR